MIPTLQMGQMGRRRIGSATGGGTTVALLNMGGADGSTTFTDSTGLRTWTAAGNAQIDTSNGYNAAQFDGTGDRVTTPYVKADFDWWTQDFVIEAWILASAFTNWFYLDGFTKPAMIGCADPVTNTNYWSFGPATNSAIGFYYYNGSGQIVTTGATAGSLTHIAMTHAAANNHIYLAVDGTVADKGVVSGTPQSSATAPVVLTLGQINNRCINGFVKALRITQGSTRGYTANFTPPSAPF